MITDSFEQTFSDFIDRTEYDEAENALFTIVRTAFQAGWKAAGSTPSYPQNCSEIAPE